MLIRWSGCHRFIRRICWTDGSSVSSSVSSSDFLHPHQSCLHHYLLHSTGWNYSHLFQHLTDYRTSVRIFIFCIGGFAFGAFTSESTSFCVDSSLIWKSRFRISVSRLTTNGDSVLSAAIVRLMNSHLLCVGVSCSPLSLLFRMISSLRWCLRVISLQTVSFRISCLCEIFYDIHTITT